MPELLNIWSGPDGEITFIRIQITHNDSAVDPLSECQGKITISFRFQNKREKERNSTCPSCGQPVKINLVITKLELGMV